MNIAVVAWGSLIWDPKTLAISGRWRTDGPRLPIEFARISSGGRLTLVLHPPSVWQKTYWTLSTHDVIDAARANLAKRESSPIDRIHCALRERIRDPAVVRRLRSALVRCSLDECFVNELDAHGPFSDRRRDSLDTIRANVTHREDTRVAGLEEVWSARKWPAEGRQCLGVEVAPRQDKTLRVRGHAAAKPFRIGAGAGHREDVSDRPGGPLAGGVVLPGDAFQVFVAFESHDSRPAPKRDARRLFDAPNQISRHAGC